MKWYALAVAAITLGLTAPASAQVCPVALPGVQTGILPLTPLLNEISGIVASRKNPGVLWVHNDSGDGARVYALKTDGTYLGTYDLQGAAAVDYEDIALGPGPTPGIDYLYIGDVGDNLRVRSSVVVYRVPEPSVDVNQTPVTVTLANVDALPLQYPTTAFDCESLLLDPLNQDLYLITKDANGSGDNGTSFVFRSPAPHTAGVLTTLTQVASINLGTSLFNRATGGDISPNGDTILLRSYSTLRAWPRGPGQTIAQAMGATACILPLQSELQGESVGFAGDGLGYYTASEKSFGPPQPPIYFYAIPIPETWVDFAFGGFENGSQLNPWNTLAEGSANIAPGGIIKIKGNTAAPTTAETLTINQDVTIQAISGAVSIGIAARAAGRSSATGFVSRRERGTPHE